jgi:carboxymethylenebutenolidase
MRIVIEASPAELALNEYQHYLIQEFADEYHEGHMTRRQLLRRAVLIMGSVPAGLGALAAFGCGGDDDDEQEATIAANTPEPPTQPANPSPSASVAATASAASGTIQTADVKFKGPASNLLGYSAKPAGEGPFPGVVVIHENRGLVEHLKDVTRRYANEGFAALAVDLVSRNGGSKADGSANTGYLGSANIPDLVADMVAYVDYWKDALGVKKGGVGVTGFCFGGGYTWDTVVSSNSVKAGVPYYGTCRQIDKLANTKVAVLAIYGGNDTRITGESENVRTALQKSGTNFDIQVYQGANHAFFNDTGTSYNEAAARDAWAKTLAWFRKYV